MIQLQLHMSIDQRQLPPYSMVDQHRQAQPPYNVLQGAESGVTRPFSNNAINRRSALVQDQRESRMAGIMTLFILVLTLLLLGFSIYLAIQLNFIPFGNTTPTPVPTPAATVIPSVAVPDLVGQDIASAQSLAQSKGFKLQINNGLTAGKVKKQAPDANSKAASGSTILVELEKTVKIPDLAGKTIIDATVMLKNAGLQYTITSDPAKPKDPNEDFNVVTHTDPAAGSDVTLDKQVTLYVTNYVTVTPTIAPVIQPTTPPPPQPTAAPTPTPQPTATPTPLTTATPTASVTAVATKKPKHG